jgi:hypothetical protein
MDEVHNPSGSGCRVQRWINAIVEIAAAFIEYGFFACFNFSKCVGIRE